MPIDVVFSKDLTIEGFLTVSEVIEKLKEMKPDEPVFVFTEGKLFPCLDVQKFGGIIEIGGGWGSIEGFDPENNNKEVLNDTQ